MENPNDPANTVKLEEVTGGDKLREKPWRYLGYANEIGEAFRPLVSRKVVNASYAVASLYVVADTLSKSHKVYKRTNKIGPTLTTGGDVLIWQTLASVIIPGFTINRITKYSMQVLKRVDLWGPARLWGATIIGLMAIPVIITPIDYSVDTFMNLTYRQIFTKHY